MQVTQLACLESICEQMTSCSCGCAVILLKMPNYRSGTLSRTLFRLDLTIGWPMAAVTTLLLVFPLLDWIGTELPTDIGTAQRLAQTALTYSSQRLNPYAVSCAFDCNRKITRRQSWEIFQLLSSKKLLRRRNHFSLTLRRR